MAKENTWLLQRLVSGIDGGHQIKRQVLHICLDWGLPLGTVASAEELSVCRHRGGVLIRAVDAEEPPDEVRQADGYRATQVQRRVAGLRQLWAAAVKTADHGVVKCP